MRVSYISGLLLAAFLLGSSSIQAQTSDFGTVAISYRPVDAVIYIDGERWASPTPGGPVVVQLLPGRHNVEVRAPNHKWFSADVDVRAGQSTPLNVSLTVSTTLPPQDLPPPPPSSTPAPPGPIQQTSVTPSGDGWMIAPDFKITSVNHNTTGLAGLYGGAVFAGKLLVGAGAYWEMDSYYSDHLAYGGAVVEYRFLSNSPVGISAHGLAGYGQLWGSHPVGYGGQNGRYYGYPYAYPYEGFFVGEPQLQVVARFGPAIRFVGGVGYRFTTSDVRDLDGVTGSFSLQFGR